MVNVNLFIFVLIGFFTCLCTLRLVPIFISLAIRIGLIDAPDGIIKKHIKPVPYLGGAAICCGFLCGLIFSFSITETAIFLLIGTIPLLFLGLLDDIKPMKPSKKFLGQFICALWLIQLSFYFEKGFFYSNWHFIVFTFWFLTITNAFNLIDVMDGLATIVALGVTSSFLSLALLLNNNEIILPLMALCFSFIAFLWYNKPPAQIYLGDAGSLWLGGLCAIIPLFFTRSFHSLYNYCVPIFILSIPLLEIFFLIVIRSYKKIPFYLGSPHHFSHYLQSNGWSKQCILLYVAIISIILNIVSCLYIQNLIEFSALIMGSVLLFCIWSLFLVFKS